MKKKPIFYYVLEFTIDSDPRYGSYTSSICGLGTHKPTIDEAKEFWKKDCELYKDGTLTDIYRISKEEAHQDYDMENEANFPIFGI